MYGQSIKDLSPKEKQKMYITPFFVWANYDIQEQTIERMSAFYLGALILKTANCKMDKYQSYLWQLFNRYPVIQNGATWDAEGNFYDSEKMKKLPELKNYSYLQYYRMN